MMPKNEPLVTAMPATPIANFSQCHVGILGQLQALAELPDLIGPAQRARAIASDMLHFFDAVIIEHHREEEDEPHHGRDDRSVGPVRASGCHPCDRTAVGWPAPSRRAG